MDVNSTYWFFKKFKDDNLCLLYSGSFSDEITDRFVSISEFNINNFEEFKKVKKRISFLLIECFQNVVRHRERKLVMQNKQEDLGFFLTRNYKGKYLIASGNLIENKNIDDLQRQLKKVNSLSADELKELHRYVMQNQGLSDKGGAGLGLIDIARKSGQKLEYLFENYKAELSFYYNQITLKSQDDSENNREKIFPISDAIENHKKMMNDNIMVIQRGDFSHKTILPILTIIETNLKDEHKESTIKKQIYHILVELLQNINKHCLISKGLKDGILILGKTNGKFIINAGNYIHFDKISEFDKHLKMINSMNKEDLKNLYMQKLIDVTDYSENAGIGLIDIARYINSPLDYTFTKVGDEKYFYSICVSI